MTRSASQGDSRVHYDSEPRIFQGMLDRNMNYSSGIYPGGGEALDAAQLAKMHRIAQICGFRPGQKLLDLGCGWSGPALFFAEHYGLHVTGVTLSPVQRDFGRRWAAERGLADRLEILVHDVLDLPLPRPSFDHAIFLESIIHMERKAELFQECHRLLRPGGVIFIQESCYDRQSKDLTYRATRGRGETEQAFGHSGHMVSGGEMLRLLEEAGFVPYHLENISADYQKTLAQWLDRLDQNADWMRALAPDTHSMLRRYLMVALGTYRLGTTVCHLMAARNTAA